MVALLGHRKEHINLELPVVQLVDQTLGMQLVSILKNIAVAQHSTEAAGKTLWALEQLAAPESAQVVQGRLSIADAHRHHVCNQTPSCALMLDPTPGLKPFATSLEA
jgi:hypothetical protein